MNFNQKGVNHEIPNNHRSIPRRNVNHSKRHANSAGCKQQWRSHFTVDDPNADGYDAADQSGIGDQTNPNVACNLASYTDDHLDGVSLIKYFDFATNTEHAVVSSY
jgi:hypothetical protein